MSELAFNMNGEPFEVPAAATGWRVRRMKQKGAPEAVYGRDGLPLVLPIEAGVEELRDAVGAPGRYRVDPIEDHRAIPNAPAGYVFIHESDLPTSSLSKPGGMPPASDSIVIEAMRMNSELAKTVIDRFPLMMEAAATLLRAADGAGLPARPPMAIEVDDDTEEEPATASSGFDINALVAQMIPVIVAGFTTGKLKMPELGSILDWRKAGNKKATRPSPAAQPATEPVANELPPLDPTAMAHVIAVQSALEPHEVAFVQEVAKELSATELRSWLDELSQLSVPDAVARIRALIVGKANKDGAS